MKVLNAYSIKVPGPRWSPNYKEKLWPCRLVKPVARLRDSDRWVQVIEEEWWITRKNLSAPRKTHPSATFIPTNRSWTVIELKATLWDENQAL